MKVADVIPASWPSWISSTSTSKPFVSAQRLTMRNNMITTLAEDYVKMARAKGLRPLRIMLLYAGRNAVLPNVTGFALSLGFGAFVWARYGGQQGLEFFALGFSNAPIMGDEVAGAILRCLEDVPRVGDVLSSNRIALHDGAYAIESVLLVAIKFVVERK